MAKKGIKRTAVAVPKDDNEAARFIAQIGDKKREIEGLQAEAEEKITSIKLNLTERIEILGESIFELLDGLFVYADANRERLTEGKTKTIKFTTGTISWRMTPPKVNIRDNDKVIEQLEKMGLERFIRTSKEPNKESMLEEKEVAEGVKGVTITQHEEFVVKPDSIEAEVTKKLSKLKK